MKLFDYILYLILLPFTFISYIITPMTHDVEIYQGVARLTDYFGTFPQNIDLAWEIKPIANRGIHYLFQKIVINFVDINNHVLYSMGIKILSLILLVSICYLLSTRFKDVKYVFPLLVVTMLSATSFAILQAEWFAVLFSLLALYLLMSDKGDMITLGGICLTTIFLFKGISVLLIIPIILALYLFQGKDNIENFYIKCAVAGMGCLASLYILIRVFPHIIPDAILSGGIAHIGSADIITMISGYFNNLFISILYIPIISMSLICGYLLFMKYLIGKEYYKSLCVVIMYVITTAIIYIQSEFFVYHYMVYGLCGVVCIILLNDKFKDLIKYTIILLFTIFVIFNCYFGLTTNEEIKFFQDRDVTYNQIIKDYPDLITQQSVLYLDIGDAPYYFGVNSSCRYIQSLPFQRDTLNYSLNKLEQYKDNYNCIINYNGKYIISSPNDWIIRDTNNSINLMNKLNREYKVIINDKWKIYKHV